MSQPYVGVYGPVGPGMGRRIKYVPKAYVKINNVDPINRKVDVTVDFSAAMGNEVDADMIIEVHDGKLGGRVIGQLRKHLYIPASPVSYEYIKEYTINLSYRPSNSYVTVVVKDANLGEVKGYGQKEIIIGLKASSPLVSIDPGTLKPGSKTVRVNITPSLYKVMPYYVAGQVKVTVKDSSGRVIGSKETYVKVGGSYDATKYNINIDVPLTRPLVAGEKISVLVTSNDGFVWSGTGSVEYERVSLEETRPRLSVSLVRDDYNWVHANVVLDFSDYVGKYVSGKATIKVKDSSGQELGGIMFDVDIPPSNDKSKYKISETLRLNKRIGPGKAVVEVYGGGKLIASASATIPDYKIISLRDAGPVLEVDETTVHVGSSFIRGAIVLRNAHGLGVKVDAEILVKLNGEVIGKQTIHKLIRDTYAEGNRIPFSILLSKTLEPGGKVEIILLDSAGNQLNKQMYVMPVENREGGGTPPPPSPPPSPPPPPPPPGGGQGGDQGGSGSGGGGGQKSQASTKTVHWLDALESLRIEYRDSPDNLDVRFRFKNMDAKVTGKAKIVVLDEAGNVIAESDVIDFDSMNVNPSTRREYVSFPTAVPEVLSCMKSPSDCKYRLYAGDELTPVMVDVDDPNKKYRGTPAPIPRKNPSDLGRVEVEASKGPVVAIASYRVPGGSVEGSLEVGLLPLDKNGDFSGLDRASATVTVKIPFIPVNCQHNPSYCPLEVRFDLSGDTALVSKIRSWVREGYEKAKLYVRDNSNGKVIGEASVELASLVDVEKTTTGGEEAAQEQGSGSTSANNQAKQQEETQEETTGGQPSSTSGSVSRGTNASSSSSHSSSGGGASSGEEASGGETGQSKGGGGASTAQGTGSVVAPSGPSIPMIYGSYGLVVPLYLPSYRVSLGRTSRESLLIL